jgi:hypothetical protein
MIDEEKVDGPSMVEEEGLDTTVAFIGTSTSMVRLPPLKLEQIERVELTPPHVGLEITLLLLLCPNSLYHYRGHRQSRHRSSLCQYLFLRLPQSMR